MAPLCFLHGLDSSPQGTKAALIRKYYPQCLIPSLPPDIDERVRIVERKIRKNSIVVGSSLGGLTALMVAIRHPELTRALLLLAPAVGFRDESLFTPDQNQMLATLHVPAGIPTVIVAGTGDDVIPLSSIRALVRRSPDPEQIRLHEVDDDHNLHRSLGLMLDSIERLQAQVSNQAEGV